MQVAVNNIKKQEDLDFKQRVLETMKKQIIKKIIGQEEGSRLRKSCDAPFINNKSIQQIQNQTV